MSLCLPNVKKFVPFALAVAVAIGARDIPIPKLFLGIILRLPVNLGIKIIVVDSPSSREWGANLPILGQSPTRT